MENKCKCCKEWNPACFCICHMTEEPEDSVLEPLYEDKKLFKRECEKCEQVVCYRLESGHYRVDSATFHHQTGNSKKYEGEVGSYCKEHNGEKKTFKLVN